ncbi:MAG: ComF family protein [Candidatus Aminicenantes bacterium]|nr:ComF family protein [Candidatus Aminicenantes bacterium]
MCGCLLDGPGERLVCRACLEGLEAERRAVCARCGLFLQAAGPPDACASCVRNPPPFVRHRSAGIYAGRLKQAILIFKYRGGEVLGRDLARFAWEALREDAALWEGVDGVLAVPLHRRRLRERGFNQAAVLARRLAKRAGIPYRDGLLVRRKNIAPQAGLNSFRRRRNVSGAFAVRRWGEVLGCSLLLVDDVYTTGSTVAECCRVLLRAGAGDVRVLTLARAQN